MPHDQWDPESPPAEPPAGADVLVWRLAYRLFRDHRPHGDGFCVTCREFWPCGPRELADRGFEAAFRAPGAGRGGSHGNPGGRF
jgi:hypothetical protein